MLLFLTTGFLFDLNEFPNLVDDCRKPLQHFRPEYTDLTCLKAYSLDCKSAPKERREQFLGSLWSLTRGKLESPTMIRSTMHSCGHTTEPKRVGGLSQTVLTKSIYVVWVLLPSCVINPSTTSPIGTCPEPIWSALHTHQERCKPQLWH